MIAKHYKNREKKHFEQCPEALVVQYILPCFVASFLDLDKDPSVSLKHKAKYQEFIHELIKCYERHEYSQVLLFKLDHVNFSLNALPKLLKDICEDLKNIEENIQRFFPNCKPVYAMFSKGIVPNVQYLYVPKKIPRNNDVDAHCFYLKIDWAFQIYMLIYRMRHALKKINCFQEKQPKHNTLSQLFRFIERTSPMVDEDKVTEYVAYLLHFMNSFHSLALDLEITDVYRSLLIGIKELSFEKNVGIFLFCATIYLRAAVTKKIQGVGPAFPLNPVDVAVWHLNVREDLRKVKESLSTEFKLRVKNEDTSLVSILEAKSSYCHSKFLHHINSQGKLSLMTRPGEVTLFPIKHCRWCGMVTIEDFRVCTICIETPEYPDLNLFCSIRCEKEALEHQHEEEHARFLMKQCGIRFD
jgi:hypothetical protein